MIDRDGAAKVTDFGLAKARAVAGEGRGDRVEADGSGRGPARELRRPDPGVLLTRAGAGRRRGRPRGPGHRRVVLGGDRAGGLCRSAAHDGRAAAAARRSRSCRHQNAPGRRRARPARRAGHRVALGASTPTPAVLPGPHGARGRPARGAVPPPAGRALRAGDASAGPVAGRRPVQPGAVPARPRAAGRGGRPVAPGDRRRPAPPACDLQPGPVALAHRPRDRRRVGRRPQGGAVESRGRAGSTSTCWAPPSSNAATSPPPARCSTRRRSGPVGPRRRPRRPAGPGGTQPPRRSCSTATA